MRSTPWLDKQRRKNTLFRSCTGSKEKHSLPLLHRQWTRALYSAPAHAAEKSPLLRSCTRSGEEPSTPLLHLQRRRALYSAPALAAEKSPLLRCMCRSGEEPSACAGAEKSPLL